MKQQWPVKKLGEVVILRQGQQVAKEFQINKPRDGYVKFVRIIDYTRNNLDVRYVPASVNKNAICNEDDLIMVRYGQPGLVGRGIAGIFANNMFKIDIKNAELDKGFLFYLLNSHHVQKFIKLNLLVSGLPAINHNIVKKIQIPNPPIKLQKDIVERLDAIRKAQELCDQQIQKTEELFESIFQEELENGINKWPQILINRVVSEISDGNYSSKYPRSSEFVNSGIPFIRAINFKEGKLIWKDMRYITPEKHLELKKGHLKVNDILITNRGEIGTAALVTSEFEDANINAQIVRLQPDSKTIIPLFLYFILRSNFVRKQISQLTTGSTLRQLSIQNLNLLKIVLPPFFQQQKIVEKLEAVQNYKKLLQKEKALLKELFDSVLDKSMKGEMDN